MQMETLKNELDVAITELSQMIEDVETPVLVNETLDKTTVLQMLDELELLIKDNDIECLTYVNTLRSIPGTEELIRMIENFDIDPALESLAELKKEYK